MPFKPILLRGHTRPLTCVKFNREGDLVFTCAKDHKPNVWFAENGERLGTFNGHSGAVYSCDVNWHTTRLITGSADRTVKLWEVESGKELFSWDLPSGIRSVNFASGDNMFLAATDSTFSQKPTVFIFNLNEEEKVSPDPVADIVSDEDSGNINEAAWDSLNHNIYTACADGCVRIWDVETGKQVQKIKAHSKSINSLQFSKDKTMFVTASSDMTSNLYDTKSGELLKTYKSDRPLNAAAISPSFPHVICGGGQEAMNVTITRASAGHFEVDFFHLFYQDFLGSVKGHFGPVNTLAFSPNGKSFVSGAEDGYVRLHNFDKETLASMAKNQTY